jgi:uncharacterized protein YhaN
MSIQIEVSSQVYELDGTRKLSADEFSTLQGYVTQYNQDLERMQTQKAYYQELEKKVLNLTPDENLSEDDLDALGTLAELKVDSINEQINKVLAQIDQIWRVAPETVTGGGYELHIARD